jgi:hypothetical protein
VQKPKPTIPNAITEEMNMFKTPDLLCLAVLVCGIVAAAEGARSPDKKPKLDTLAVHRTIARFEGAPYRLCRGLTAMCPDRCGHSGEFATFTIVEYLKYEKPGKYGDPRQTQFSFQVSGFDRKPKGDPKLRTIVSGLKKGDLVLLGWDHLYGEVKPGLTSPVRPVVELRKISQEEADRLRAEATKKTATDPGNRADSRNSSQAPRGSVPLALVSAAAPKKKATAAEAEAAAKKWLDSLGDKGLVLVEKADDTGFVGRKVIGRSSTIFTYQKPGWWISLGFSEVIDAETPLAVVRKRLKYVALDRLPTPGLDVPGWEIRPRTPTSSFRDGVEIVNFRDGRIKVHIKSGFFALYGRDPSVLVPADAPLPKTAYFMVRQKFPLDLKIDAPLAMK